MSRRLHEIGMKYYLMLCPYDGEVVRVFYHYGVEAAQDEVQHARGIIYCDPPSTWRSHVCSRQTLRVVLRPPKRVTP